MLLDRDNTIQKLKGQEVFLLEKKLETVDMEEQKCQAQDNITTQIFSLLVKTVKEFLLE
jgi:hypothetical protein